MGDEVDRSSEYIPLLLFRTGREVGYCVGHVLATAQGKVFKKKDYIGNNTTN
jgi:hypothetical protein